MQRRTTVAITAVLDIETVSTPEADVVSAGSCRGVATTWRKVEHKQILTFDTTYALQSAMMLGGTREK